MTLEKSKGGQTQMKVEMANQIVSMLQGIDFGSLEIIIHDGKVVQIERKEKLRFDTK
jgi:hypothetical protein